MRLTNFAGNFIWALLVISILTNNSVAGEDEVKSCQEKDAVCTDEEAKLWMESVKKEELEKGERRRNERIKQGQDTPDDAGTDSGAGTNQNTIVIVICVVLVLILIVAVTITLVYAKRQKNYPVDFEQGVRGTRAPHKDPENPEGIEKTPVDVQDGKEDGIKFAGLGIQGWCSFMEDRHVCQVNVADGVHLFAVFDGHAGFEVSEYCKQHFVETLKKNENFQKKEYQAALEETYMKMDDILETPEVQAELKAQCNHKLKKDQKCDPGTSANMVLVTPEHIVCANAGDSRTILSRGRSKSDTVPLSTDHNPEDKGELARIEKAGGYVLQGRICQILNCSRAIGDLDFKTEKEFPQKERIVSSFPDVTVTKRTSKDQFLLLGTGPFWDVYSNAEAAKEVYNKIFKEERPTADAFLGGVGELVNSCWTRNYGDDGKTFDNISAIVVELK